MTLIYPISDMRNHFNRISELCHAGDEPVFLTKNGRADLVVMSQAAYDRQVARLELYAKLGAAERESADGMHLQSHDDVMAVFREKADARKHGD